MSTEIIRIEQTANDPGHSAVAGARQRPFMSRSVALPLLGALLVGFLPVQPLVTVCGLLLFVPVVALEGYLAWERRAAADGSP